MYVFYEHYRFGGETTTSKTRTHLTQMITVHVNPRESFIKLMEAEHGRDCKYCKSSKKLYIRKRVSKAKIHWSKDKISRECSLVYVFSENYVLGMSVGFPLGGYYAK